MKNQFDVIIVGGSYAGLSAAMSLGRSLRTALIIDSGAPCNRQTPQSHNFITHDGENPGFISEKAKEQVLRYPTIKFFKGIAIAGQKKDALFQIDTDTGESFRSKKLLFATGLKDIMPDLQGFVECWGISVLHCPYCHGYEVRNEKTGIIGNGNTAFELVKLISHWTGDLVLFTNGPATFTEDQSTKIRQHKVTITETAIDSIAHSDGHISHINLKDGGRHEMKAIYARPEVRQHCNIPTQFGCELTDHNLLKVDAFQKTSVPGIFAAGDNSILGRAVSLSVASGTLAGAAINRELIDESF